MELTAIEDFRTKADGDPLYKGLADIVEKDNNLWSPEAERYLLANAKPI